MKKIMYLLLAVVLLSCQQVSDKPTYTVVGNFTADFAGKTMTLVNMHTDEVLDSAIILESGAFEFNGTLDAPFIAEVRINEQKAADLIVEQDTVILDPISRKPSNTPLNDALSSYNMRLTTYESEIKEQYLALQSADMPKDEKMQQIETLINDYSQHMKEMMQEVYVEHVDDVLGTYIFCDMTQNAEPEEFMSLYQEASEMTRSYPQVEKIQGFMLAQQNTAAGKKYVDFTIEKGTVDSTSVSLSEFVGNEKYTLVDFFASWCGPCLRELPHIRKIHDNYASQVQCVGIAVWDKPSATAKAVENSNITWPVIFNAQSLPTDLYGITGIPEIILINPEGIIVARGLRGDGIEEKIREELGL